MAWLWILPSCSNTKASQIKVDHSLRQGRFSPSQDLGTAYLLSESTCGMITTLSHLQILVPILGDQETVAELWWPFGNA